MIIEDLSDEADMMTGEQPGAGSVPGGLLLGNHVYPLDSKQLNVVISPAELPQVVFAPPGTGKTHLVVGRIGYLIEKAGLQPYELLVLCFTRTAVREIITRLQGLITDAGVHDDLRFVTVRTFDSFTTRALLGARGSADLRGFSYNQRIELAIEALEDPESEASEMAARYRHLIVDEAQDLVGARLRLVEAILRRFHGGFTILGDPAQAIYDFSERDDPAGPSSGDLLNWLHQQPWIQQLIERELSEDHRSRGPAAEVARRMRRHILNTAATDRRALDAIRALVDGLEQAGGADEPGPALTRGENETVCVLCRTHGEVLQLASLLALRNVPFSVRPRPDDHGTPAWLGRVFGTYTSRRISRGAFEDRWTALVGAAEGTPPPLQAWDYLKHVEGHEHDDLDVSELASRMWHGYQLPDDEDAYALQDVGGIALSTIHAVKGREFDRVVVLQSARSSPSYMGSNPLEEARVLYVAATRARQELARLGRQGLPEMWRTSCEDGRRRWMALDRQSRRRFIEIGLAGDVKHCSAVDSRVNESAATAAQVQEQLWSRVKVGEAVYVGFASRGAGRFYMIQRMGANGNHHPNLGQLSWQFVDDIKAQLKACVHGSSYTWPTSWRDIHVTAVVTEVLPSFPANFHEPYATSRFCLGVQVRGMGYLCKE